MSAYPIMLDGSSLAALVVGGGKVATRKIRTLLDAGASVHVVAPEVSTDLAMLAADSSALRLTRARYSPALLGGEQLVIAATDDPDVNAAVAADARALCRFVNVVSDPEAGNCVTPAVHRAGDLVIAVTAGRVPAAAKRIRDRVGATIDARYADAVRELSTMRRRMIDDGQRERWTVAATALLGPDFCEQVESGQIMARIGEWA